jgi:hypothetical protein
MARRSHAPRFTIAVAAIAVLAGLILTAGTSSAKPKQPKPSKPSTTTTTTTTTTTPPASGVWRGAGLISLPSACADVHTLGLSWYYDWWTWKTAPCPGVPYVPMIYDASMATSKIPVPPGSHELLGFNEPDNASQANMTPAQAVALWPKLMATGLRLGSPATKTGNTAWMDAFMAGIKANGYRVDFLAVHWYGDCSRPANLVDYLNQMHARYGLPVWLTEFSCWKQSRAVNDTFVAQVMPQLRTLPWLERVAWFTNRPYPAGWEFTNLIDSTGALTSTGRLYG